MAISLKISITSLFLILSAFLLLLLTPSTTADNNVLLTGETLPTDDQLTYGDYTFVMQGDCNLVLYNGGRGFQSNTHGRGNNCNLTFTANGRLTIRDDNSKTVWITPNFYSKNGSYAAVLRPDGEVAIYGPVVWSVPVIPRQYGKLPAVRNIPLVNNVLFSGQILYDGGKLTSRDYSFVMKSDCNMALDKAGQGAMWETSTAGNGAKCFLRLDHRGKLTILDDLYRTIWSSNRSSEEGEYVLILQYNGQAVIYGPLVWSTATGSLNDGNISMVTAKE